MVRMRATVTQAATRQTVLRALVIALLVLGVAIGHALITDAHRHAAAADSAPAAAASQELAMVDHDGGAPSGAETMAVTCLAVLLAAAVALLRRVGTAELTIALPAHCITAQPRASAVPGRRQRTTTVLQI